MTDTTREGSSNIHITQRMTGFRPTGPLQSPLRQSLSRQPCQSRWERLTGTATRARNIRPS